MTKKKSKSKKEDVKKIEDVVAEQCDEVKVKQETKHYYVCQGKTITSKRGLKISGNLVCEDDLGGGKKSLDRLLNMGCLELR